MKHQFMVLVDESEMTRLDALRVVMYVSRAEVNRRVLKGQTFEQLESDPRNAERLARLDVLAERVGGYDRARFVRELVVNRKDVPALEVLEAMSAEDLRAELRNPPDIEPAA